MDVNARKLSDYETLVLESENIAETAVSLILAWVAVCDGSVDDREKQLLDSVAGEEIGNLPAFTAIARRNDRKSIQLACEILQSTLTEDEKLLFLQVVIGMVIADGKLANAENHVLRFLADVLGVNNRLLDSIFCDATGKECPPPGDPSDASYWQRNTYSDSQSEHSEEDRKDRTRSSMSTSWARSILGVTDTATSTEIRAAYRRLAQVHHPDRYQSLGEEAIRTATTTFQNIEQAYRVLKANA